MLGLGSKIKYHNIFDQIPLYGHCHDIVGMTIGTLATYNTIIVSNVACVPGSDNDITLLQCR